VVYTPESYLHRPREKYGIPEDAFVYGLHQRNDPTISSTLNLEAFSRIVDDKVYFLILGGTDVHREYVSKNNIKNVVFVNFTSNVEEIHSFLSCLDVYTHCRQDGEVCSASIIEAMSHYKPVISYPGINMGHAEQIDGCGIMAYSLDEYSNAMVELKENRTLYSTLSERTKQKYHSLYDYRIVEDQIISLLNID
jgi:glycosyltransferase involved in cell wall biosynthesis